MRSPNLYSAALLLVCLLAGCGRPIHSQSNRGAVTKTDVSSVAKSKALQETNLELTESAPTVNRPITDLPWRELLQEHLPSGMGPDRLERMFQHLQLASVSEGPNDKWTGRVTWRSTAKYQLQFEQNATVRVARDSESADEMVDEIVCPSPPEPSHKAWAEFLERDPNLAVECKVRSSRFQGEFPLAAYGGLVLGSQGIKSAEISTPDDRGRCRLTLISEGESYTVVFSGSKDRGEFRILHLDSINDVSPATFLQAVNSKYSVVGP